MRLIPIVLLSCVTLAIATSNASADGPLALSGMQLDEVTPLSSYEPTQYQLRVSVDAFTSVDPDRTRNALAMEDLEASMAAQQITEDSEERCTPARKALLAVAGLSASSAWQSAPAPAATVRSSAPPRRPAMQRSGRLLWTHQAATPGETASAADAPTAVRPAVIAPRSAASTRRAVGRTPASPSVVKPVRHVRIAPPAMRSKNPPRIDAVPDRGNLLARMGRDLTRSLSAMPMKAIGIRR